MIYAFLSIVMFQSKPLLVDSLWPPAVAGVELPAVMLLWPIEQANSRGVKTNIFKVLEVADGEDNITTDPAEDAGGQVNLLQILIRK